MDIIWCLYLFLGQARVNGPPSHPWSLPNCPPQTVFKNLVVLNVNCMYWAEDKPLVNDLRARISSGDLMSCGKQLESGRKNSSVEYRQAL